MKRRIPSLIALECFEQVMKTGQVTRAAEALNLTQSAVSRQIGNLEEFVRQSLFTRERKRLIPTEAGKQYADAVAPLLAGLESETLRLITWGADDRVLRLGLLPTFGSRWLIPRLGVFTNAYPDIQLNIITGLTPDDFKTANADVAVQYGDGNWPGMTSHKVVDEEIIAVVAPALMKGKEDANIADYDRLLMTTRPTVWTEWLEGTGLSDSSARGGAQFENFTMMIEAARSGLGVAVLPLMYVADDLATGRLIAPFGGPVKSRNAYYLAYADGRGSLRKVKTFRDWLIKEATR
ncbi:LysR substrate-binding domain-containing protein [Kordiimonas lacus]|uniref:DNA-binding transcriptional regulator, LysR family n=1 Tax=Kordiimonas lacus TaxID=637679 RepID=A0A1G6YIF3_9PROT|nr:LysR substrate-binding domain-containing protein [Kordiimonas lacus]SDD89763.1 DNA-binding transcriptional regulator, LysR family [Kordiimonas lacus]